MGPTSSQPRVRTASEKWEKDGTMAARETRREKIFTASQANATSPLVRAIVSDLVSFGQRSYRSAAAIVAADGRPAPPG